MVAARDAKLDEVILALRKQVNLDDDYRAIYDAFEAGMDPKNLPRDHLAQAAAGVWPSLSLELDISNLVLYIGRLLVPETVKTEILDKLQLSHVGEKEEAYFFGLVW